MNVLGLLGYHKRRCVQIRHNYSFVVVFVTLAALIFCCTPSWTQECNRPRDKDLVILETVCTASTGSWANGDELRLRLRGKVLLQLTYAGYDKEASRIRYRLWLPKDAKVSDKCPPLELMGATIPSNLLEIIPIDGKRGKGISYRFFRSVTLKNEGVQVEIYLKSTTLKYYSLSRNPKSLNLTLERRVNDSLLSAYKEWNPLAKPFRQPELEDCYLKVFVQGPKHGNSLGKGFIIKVGLPIGGFSAPFLMAPAKLK